MSNIALIPMRGGSKSIPHKNIKLIAGKPLCFWTIDAAIHASSLDKVYVSTDSDAIESVVSELFAENLSNQKLIIVKRDPALAQDETSTEAVVNDFIKDKEFENFCLIQATSPLLTSSDIDASFKKIEEGYDSTLTVARLKRFFWTEEGKPINYDIFKRPRRQDFAGSLVENGECSKARKILASSKVFI